MFLLKIHIRGKPIIDMPVVWFLHRFSCLQDCDSVCQEPVCTWRHLHCEHEPTKSVLMSLHSQLHGLVL